MAAPFIRLSLPGGANPDEIPTASFRPDIIGICTDDIRDWFLDNFLLRESKLAASFIRKSHH
jgi:hypothetical protein